MNFNKNKKLTLLLAAILSVHAGISFAIKAPLPSPIIFANEDGELGLNAAKDIELATGKSYSPSDVNAITGNMVRPNQFVTPQANWYFEKEMIAVPRVAMPAGEHDAAKIYAVAPISSFSIERNAQEDVARWNKDKHVANTLPPLIWLGSPQVITQAKLIANNTILSLEDNPNISFIITPKIPTNLSFWNKSTDAFFAEREIRLRGTNLGEKGFEARTVWPLDYRLPTDTPLKALDGLNGETLQTLVQHENGGAKSVFEARLLHGSGKAIAGKAVIALMLNGAQGDDDEALGGHFGLATGRVGANGDMSKWLVNNYYNLGSNSEKGIIAAATSMDKYLMDVNNGQSYYRPSYMLVAVMRTDTLPSQVQDASNIVLNHFYRNDFVYDHSRDNCAGISIDTLRTLGWNVPERGVTSRLKAVVAYFYIAATEKSLTKGRAIYDYLTTETTRLFPAAAFDAIGHNMLDQTRKLWIDHHPQTTFTKQLGDEIEAVYFVRIPQVPSSRAYGTAPVYSFDEYMKTAPADHSKWKMVPTTPRVLPENLKDGLALKPTKVSPIPWPVAVVSLSLCWGLLWGFRKAFKFTRKYSNENH